MEKYAIAVILSLVLLLSGGSATVSGQALNEPPFPQCPAGALSVREFGPGELLRPAPLSNQFGFTPPAGYGPYGELIVWQGEGHHWDDGCTEGPDNDPPEAVDCDQDQQHETITFFLNGEAVGAFIDHTPDTDRNFRYEFALSNIEPGLNQLRLVHPNVGDPGDPNSPNSVFYKGTVCVFEADAPAIEIKKYTNGEDADVAPGPEIRAGEPVTWTYIVTNTGVVELTSVTVTDDKGVTVTCPKTTLAPGEGMTCTAIGTATLGQYANLGTVQGTPPAGPNVTDSDPSHYFGISPDIEIKKYTNGEDADTPTGPVVEVGSTVTWTYVVTNTGLITLTDVTVTDDQGVTVDCLQDTLGIGESMICTATGTAKAGQYANVGMVVGTPQGGQLGTVTDSDPSHYFGFTPPQVPAIVIEKATNGEDADTPTGPFVPVGGEVTWTYVVTNTGNVPLSNVQVTDDQGEEVSCPKTTLVPGGSMTCTALGIAVSGQYSNTSTVVGFSPEEERVTDSDPSHYFGAVETAVGDYVWLDDDGDGLQDEEEEGLAGVTVNLYRVEEDALAAAGLLVDGSLISTTVTNADGLYLFDDLPLGSYFVEFIRPQGFVFTIPNVAGNAFDATDSDALVPVLALSASDGGVTARLGRPLTYTLSYSNTDSTLDAAGVVLSTTVPAGTTANLATSTPGWTCAATPAIAGTTCELAIGTVPAGATENAILVVTLGTNANAVPTRIDLVASLSQDTAGRTAVVTPPPGGADLTLDAGLLPGELRTTTQVGTIRAPGEPTGLDPSTQPNAANAIRLPLVQN